MKTNPVGASRHVEMPPPRTQSFSLLHDCMTLLTTVTQEFLCSVLALARVFVNSSGISSIICIPQTRIVNFAKIREL